MLFCGVGVVCCLLFDVDVIRVLYVYRLIVVCCCCVNCCFVWFVSIGCLLSCMVCWLVFVVGWYVLACVDVCRCVSFVGICLFVAC